MCPKKQAIYTFQQVRSQCELGSAEAWRAFLDFYAPLCFHLMGMYSPGGQEGATPQMKGLLTALSENDFARLRSTARDSEREFLNDVRALLLEALLGDGGSEPTAPADQEPKSFTLESVAKLLDGLPLTHQEMMFFRLSGYTDASVESMLRVAPRVAQEALARLEPDYHAAANLRNDRCPWPVAWLALLRGMRTAKRDDCPPLHQFLRIQDGQVSWYDKEPAEKHITSCLYCLERWSALREVGYWRRKAKPLPPNVMEPLVAALPVAAPAEKTLLQRLFG